MTQNANGDTPMGRAQREGRVRIMRLQDREVLRLFEDWRADLPHAIAYPVFSKLPQGYRILAVQNAYEFRSFDFLVVHPDFDAVPEGQMYPVHRALIEEIRVALIQPIEDPNI
jgi:hypothetical protein